MTKHARIVLQDCKYAISMHKNDSQAELFRISWISVVTLLRAIGHVLRKVDSEESNEMKYAVDINWQALNDTKPEPLIFWEFIVQERNRFLKNYEHGIVRTQTFPAVSDGIIEADMANSRGGKLIVEGAKIESYIADGPFKGQNEKEVAWKAYDWWKKTLDEIDNIVKNTV
ncbi:hypothetical protein ACFL6I_08655 [candidate division KSB1 bacterium]